MDMLENMRLFVRVVESGSFTAVAKEIDATTAQVSRAVSNLEAHVQTRLLHRTTRHLGLTESGERYFERAKSILAEIDYANAEARNALLRPSGKMRIHAMTGRAESCRVVDRALPGGQPRRVGRTDARAAMPNLVEEGYDVSIVTASQLPDSGYVAQTCGTSCSVLVASRECQRATARRSRPTSCRTTCACASTRLRRRPANGGSSAAMARRPSTNCSPRRSRSTCRTRCASRWPTVLDDIREGRLIRVLPEYRLQTVSVYAVYATRRYLDAKIRTFLDHLRTTLTPALENDLRELDRLTTELTPGGRKRA